MKIFSSTKNRLFKIGKGIRNFFTKASKTFSVLVQRTGAVWSGRDYENFAKETYMKNVIAFRCINLVASNVASIPWKLSRLDGDEIVDVENHPVNKLIKRPNPKESFDFLILKTIAYNLISGNSYVEKISAQSGPNIGIPKELYSLRPDRVTIHADESTGMVSKYEYKGPAGSIFFESDIVTGKSDILHIKQFHPLDDWYGLAPTEPAAREIDSNNEATEFNKSLLENRAVPGMIFMAKEYLSKEQWDRLEKQLRSEYSGAKNAGKNLILENAHDVRPYGFTPAEMDFIQSNRELARNIALGYGVPAQMIGIPEANNYSNYQEARLSFWEETIIPWIKRLVNEHNNWLFPEGEYFLSYDLEEIPALAIKRDKLWERAQKATFLTENEKRRMVGYEDVEGGDVILVPATMIPLNTQPTEEETNEPEGEEPEEETPTEGEEEEESSIDLDSCPISLESDLSIKELIKITEPAEEKPFPNEYSCRIEDPKQFDKIRRQNNWRKSNGKRLDAIWGIKNNKSRLQAIRYPKSSWSKAQARSHCNERDHVLFE